MQTISMDVHIKFCMWFELAVKTQLYWQFILCFFSAAFSEDFLLLNVDC